MPAGIYLAALKHLQIIIKVKKVNISFYGEFMKKIVLISLYFGKYPNYFNLWLKSAAKNSDIDFFLYGDCDVKQYEPLPKNVKCIYVSFENIKKKIQSKFDFEIALDTPYKICDYRPAYGLVFQQDISDYDYWGHFDLDTILGDLTAYLPNEDYDKIYRFGHLTMYKNTPENNVRFMDEGGMDYQKVFKTSYNMIFDELPGMSKKYEILGLSQYCEAPFADIARRRKNYTLNDNICRSNYKYQIFYYDNGKVFRDYLEGNEIKTDEFNYIHFSHRKMEDKTNGSDSFYITRFGFIEKNSKTTLETIKELNAPTPIENIFCSINTQIIRRIKRSFKLIYTKITNS